MKTRISRKLWTAALAACLLGALPADGQQTLTPPSGLRATAPGATAAGLSWKDNSNGETGFSLELHEKGASSWEYLGTLDPNLTTATVEGLDPDTTYAFRVRAASDSALSAPSNEATITTPSEDGFLTSSEFPDFRVKVQIFPAAGNPIAGKKEIPCQPETFCVSGAVAGRPEVFVRVLGPRPNGYLWPTIVRFTSSRVEVEIQQISTGEIKRYTLDAVPASSDALPGLQDRTGFKP
jgi:hypothetical protein